MRHNTNFQSEIFVLSSLLHFKGFLGKNGPYDVTKGVKISKYRNSDTTICFLVPKNLPIQNLGVKMQIYKCCIAIGRYQQITHMSQFDPSSSIHKNPGDFLLQHFQVKKLAFSQSLHT